MLLSEHIEQCQEVLKEHGDHPCYTATDAEGNGYNEVYYGVTTAFIRNIDELEVIPKDNREDIIEDDPDMEEDLKVKGFS